MSDSDPHGVKRAEPEPEYDPRPLYERLKEARQKQDEEYTEMLKMSTQLYLQH